MFLKASEWEPTPLYMRPFKRERRRISKGYYVFGFHVGYKRVWEYR